MARKERGTAVGRPLMELVRVHSQDWLFHKSLLLRWRGVSALLTGGLAGHFVGLHLFALVRGKQLLHLLVGRLANPFQLCVLLVGGECGIALHRFRLGSHVFVDFFDLSFLVVGKIQLGKLLILSLAVPHVTRLLLTRISLRRCGVLRARGGWQAA